jgi:alpha-amylase
MSKRAIVLYLHVHQPHRVRQYSVFDSGQSHEYFADSNWDSRTNNERIFRKVAEKSYLPTNAILLDLLHQHPEFKLSISITGTFIEQMEMWGQDVLDSFKKLTGTNRVEIVAETYHHSLAFFYSKFEFEKQVRMHHDKIKKVFGQEPKVFRNTELAYNNDLAYWADKAGYKGILAEGWDPVLDWRSSNFVYRPAYTENIRLLMKNYRLSDDIAFRFSNREWSEWPLGADKLVHWINELDDSQTNVNLFMDYETFGEHQWEDSGIFDMLRHLPGEFLGSREGNSFMTVSEVIDNFEPVGEIDMPNTVTWADSERDLSAWLGNGMQQDAMKHLYDLETTVLGSGDHGLINDWRKLQTSDHAYYMCTKWFRDGDVHAYFSPYESPYDAFIYYMNALRDVQLRALQIEEANK